MRVVAWTAACATAAFVAWKFLTAVPKDQAHAQDVLNDEVHRPQAGGGALVKSDSATASDDRHHGNGSSLELQPPLRHKLTVIITTSPASDHPRTEMLEQVMDSFRFVSGLASCRTIIVCDGYKLAASCNFRGGKVDDVRLENYKGYKAALRHKAGQRPGWERVELLELEGHFGFGFAVRQALPRVRTEYVCVVQHDRTFMRPVDVQSIIQGMDAHGPRISYVLLPTSSTGSGKHYAHTQRSRLGQMGWKDCDLCSASVELLSGARLLPCIQWYDSTHICRTRYYIDWVFGWEPPRSLASHSERALSADSLSTSKSDSGSGSGSGSEGRAMVFGKPPVPLVHRPGFIEDKFGQEQMKFWKLGHDEWARGGGWEPGEAGRGRDRNSLGGEGAEGGGRKGRGRNVDVGPMRQRPEGKLGGQQMLHLFVGTWKTWLLDDEEVSV